MDPDGHPSMRGDFITDDFLLRSKGRGLFSPHWSDSPFAHRARRASRRDRIPQRQSEVARESFNKLPHNKKRPAGKSPAGRSKRMQRVELESKPDRVLKLPVSLGVAAQPAWIRTRRRVGNGNGVCKRRCRSSCCVQIRRASGGVHCIKAYIYVAVCISIVGIVILWVVE
jgi:hypothetical protein